MKMYTVSRASKYCNVSPDTILQWIEAGDINAETTVGGHRRINKEELDRFLREHQMPAAQYSAGEDTKKILVVDDDKIIVETIVQSLEEDEYDYELVSAADGFEAGIQEKRFKPDLIILDVMMPDINGYEVCKRIKSDPETKEIKIIVLSAYLNDESCKQMKDYGADACFAKPLPLSELKNEVAVLLKLKDKK
ncbi:MAG: response regulator [Spirochaetota bacterium]|nr:response regulator [Spirochaetota bacterium]